MSHLKPLIDKLKELVNDDSFPLEGDDIIYLTDGDPDELPPLIQEINALACGELIKGAGECNWSNHNVLKKEGFPVVAGEKDSFGWLTGVIITSKGRIVYG